MKPRVYLDTSVLSALYDTRQPERQAMTEAFWQTRTQFELGTSTLCRDELEQIRDLSLKLTLLTLLNELNVIDVTEEARRLAQAYVAEGAFPPSMLIDAQHVAVAVSERYEVLVSWNFRHLVNRRRRARVLSVNIEHGMPPIEIVAPPEL